MKKRNIKPQPVEVPQATSPAKDFKPPLVIFCVALILRLLYLFESSESPFFDVPLSDSSTYHFLARGLLQGETGWRFFFQGVFYPSFLALIYSVFGPSVLAAKIIQAFVGAATAALTERLGFRIGGRFVGWCAGGIVACYAPLIFFDGELLATGWAAFFSVSLLLLLSQVANRPGNGWLFLTGIVGALSVLNRPVFLPVLAVCAVWLEYKVRTQNRGLVVKKSIALLLGFLIVVLPVCAFNYKVTHHFSFLPSSGGLNLYIGNNENICDTLTIRPGLKWQELVDEPVRHGIVYGADKETYFTEKFVKYATEQPGDFLAGLASKTLRFLSGREIPRNVDLYLQHKWSTLMTLGVWKVGGLGFPFGILLGLAVVGIVFRNDLRFPFPVYVFSAVYAAAVIAVFVTARYRIPIIPVSAVFAAVGIQSIAHAFQKRNRGAISKQGAVFLCTILASSIPGPFCEENIELEPELYFLASTTFVRENNIDQAMDYCLKATELNPKFFEAHKLLGLAYLQKGNPEAAARSFRLALQINPNDLQSKQYLEKISRRRLNESEKPVSTPSR